MDRIVRAERVEGLSYTTKLNGLRDDCVVLKHRAVEAVALVVSGFTVDEIVRVLPVDAVTVLETAIYQEIARRIVLAAAVVVVDVVVVVVVLFGVLFRGRPICPVALRPTLPALSADGGT